MIDEIIILNLKRDTHRKHLMIGALDTADAPLDKVRFWVGKDKRDYDNDKDKIAKAAAEDGFGEFIRYAKANAAEAPGTPAFLAYGWGYHQILRHIKETNINALVMFDDVILTCPYEILNCVFTHLIIWEEPLKFIQFSHYPIFNYKPSETVFHPLIPYLAEGPLGGDDSCMAITPNGAAFLLDYFKEHWVVCVEQSIANLSCLPDDMRTGVWSSIVPLNRQSKYMLESNIHEQHTGYEAQGYSETTKVLGEP